MLEKWLQNYNEGRSMTFYCKVCARMPLNLMNEAIKEAKEKLLCEKVDISDMKSKARILKAVVRDLALRVNIKLD